MKRINEFFSIQIPYSSSSRKQFYTAAILGILIAAIMIFLGPFDTDRFQSSHKTLIMLGFGVLFSILYMISAKVENLWFYHNNRRWEIKNEIVAFFSILLISSVPIHFYNQVFLNHFFDYEYGEFEYIEHGLWFFRHAMMPMMCIIFPFSIFFRNKFGDMTTLQPLNEIELSGINKGEKILIEKELLLFVKASENYVEIFYEKDNSIRHETFRNTLSAISRQAPFLHQCHRSYLVNIPAIKGIKGNSQNAKLEFDHEDLDVPLSKSYYRAIKSAISI